MKSKKAPPAAGQAVVLLSGGLDSSTTLYYARSKGYKCYCLIFDYGQRHSREIRSAKKIAAGAKCPYKVLKIKFPWKGSALLDRKIKIRSCGLGTKGIPATYVPARNIIFLSFAISYAETLAAKKIFIGANAVDYSGYPDCRPEFLAAFRKVIQTGTKTGPGINVEAPLMRKSKKEIAFLAQRLKVPLQLTWSCYKGGSRPCGLCDSCVLRAKGFREAGIKDPLV
ncbi:MAG: 7-cyano-7-deazaguanine synthase QueC [Candidatus Omnitrophica bacterium]|nr:7-cyano-7-deazaguanine synthase QueC [Candidatus Omnitrophota bacterium]